MMGVKVIAPGKAGDLEWLVEMISQISKSAGLPKAPEVGVYNNIFSSHPPLEERIIRLEGKK